MLPPASLDEMVLSPELVEQFRDVLRGLKANLTELSEQFTANASASLRAEIETVKDRIREAEGRVSKIPGMREKLISAESQDDKIRDLENQIKSESGRTGPFLKEIQEKLEELK